MTVYVRRLDAPEVPGKHDTPVDATVELELTADIVDDVAYGAQEVLLVVHPGGWDAAGEDELPAVRIGVAGQPVHGVAGHRVGGAVGQALQRTIEGPDATIGQKMIGVLEADEGNGRLSVLADGVPLDGRPLLGRDEPRQVHVRPRRLYRAPWKRRGPPQEMPPLHGLTEHAAG